ncbi:hypothetical protein [Listeria booriae]|uniref:hypothetical protein n=1 Tax=Listeria booriae TaxID=1552123 RepID=UPI00163D9831|nr:hypothetical protein [Listeria booriae]MBC1306819.1 hypothetical protein [Listeria booriae]
MNYQKVYQVVERLLTEKEEAVFKDIKTAPELSGMTERELFDTLKQLPSSADSTFTYTKDKTDAVIKGLV